MPWTTRPHRQPRNGSLQTQGALLAPNTLPVHSVAILSCTWVRRTQPVTCSQVANKAVQPGLRLRMAAVRPSSRRRSMMGWATRACLAPCPIAPLLALRRVRANDKSAPKCRLADMKSKAGSTLLGALDLATNDATCNTLRLCAVNPCAEQYWRRSRHSRGSVLQVQH